MIYSTYVINGELYHADRANHKYIKKVKTKNGKWRYIYNILKTTTLAPLVNLASHTAKDFAKMKSEENKRKGNTKNNIPSSSAAPLSIYDYMDEEDKEYSKTYDDKSIEDAMKKVEEVLKNEKEDEIKLVKTSNKRR